MAVEVASVGGGANLQAKTGVNPTISSQTITPDAGYDGLSSVQIKSMNDVLCCDVTITNNTNKTLLLRYGKLEFNSTTGKYYFSSNDAGIGTGSSYTATLIRTYRNKVYVNTEAETKYPIVSSHSSNVGGTPAIEGGNIGTSSPWTQYFSSLSLSSSSTDATETIVYGSIGNV